MWLSVILLAVIAGVLIGYVRGIPDDFSSADAETISGDYGYRCGDGSEFTIVPSEDMTTIRIVPATSADYLKDTTLQSVTNTAGSEYAGGGVSLSAHDATLVLSTLNTATTTCASMRPKEESLFYIGD